MKVQAPDIIRFHEKDLENYNCNLYWVEKKELFNPIRII